MVCVLRLEKKKRSEEHTSELQSHLNFVCRLLLEKKKQKKKNKHKHKKNNTQNQNTYETHTHTRTRLHRLTHLHPPFIQDHTRFSFFFLNQCASPDFYLLSLPDPLPI